MNQLVQIRRMKRSLDKATLLLFINRFVFGKPFYCSSVWEITHLNFFTQTAVGIELCSQNCIYQDLESLTVSIKAEHLLNGFRCDRGSIKWLSVKNELQSIAFIKRFSARESVTI